MLSMALLGLRLALAEAEHEKDFSPETNSLPPAKSNESAKLSGRSVFERISRDTGGKYLYKPKPSHDDITRFVNDALGKNPERKANTTTIIIKAN